MKSVCMHATPVCMFALLCVCTRVHITSHVVPFAAPALKADKALVLRGQNSC